MKIEISQINEVSIAEIISENIIINSTQDALDIMGNCTYQGSTRIIIREKNIIPDFFDLKTGIAGDILQKFLTYSVRLALVGDFKKYKSESLKDFIFESNNYGRVVFVSSVDEAKKRLVK
ncbi:MAG: DUF4180 domain-containing protein [Bacteroidales bacterium]|nr:DUF4180 domain-containing protein [Bacteroidales bacterium]